MKKTTSQDKINQEIHDGLEEQFAMEIGEHTTYKEIIESIKNIKIALVVLAEAIEDGRIDGISEEIKCLVNVKEEYER